MSGGIEHSERSMHAWMVDNLATRNGITTALRLRLAGRVAAPITSKKNGMTEFERAWARKKGFSLLSRPPVTEEPPALRIDIAILMLTLGVFLGSLIK